MLQPSSSLEGNPPVAVRAAEVVGETAPVAVLPGEAVAAPRLGVTVGVFTGMLVGDALGIVAVAVPVPNVLVGVWSDPLGVTVGVSPACPVTVGVAACPVTVGVATERGVGVGEGAGAGVSFGSPGNVSAMISARLLNPSPSESALSIGANSWPAP